MIGKVIGEAFRFALSPKRMLPYLVIDFIVLFSIMQMLVSISNYLVSRAGVLNLVLPMIGFFVIILVAGFVSLLVNGAMINQAGFYPRTKKLSASFRYAGSKYLTLFFATILLFIITFAVSFVVTLIPVIGGLLNSLLSIVIGLIFFFIYPAIIIGKKSAVDSLKHSYEVFMKNKFDVFVTWLLNSAIALVIMFLFALPAIAWMLVGIVSSGSLSSGAILSQMISMVKSPYTILFIFIFSIGMSFVALFSIGVQTRLYLALKKGPMK